MSEPAVPALPRLRRSVVPVLLTLGLGLLLAAGIGLGVGATLRTPRAGAELFVYVSVVQLVAFGSAGLVVLCALTAAGVAARTAHSGGAVRSALRVLPALALVQASQAVLAVVLAVFWVQSSLAFAVLALLSLVVDRRGSDRTLSPRTRRLALLAVPFAPVAGLALSLVGAVVAAIDTAAARRAGEPVPCLDALAARLCEPARTASLLLTAGPVALVLGLAGALAPQFLASTPQGSVASVLVLALTVTAYLTVVGSLLGAHSARHALPVPSRSPAPRERGRLRGLLLGDWGRLAGQTALVLAVAMTVTASPAGSVALAADPDAQPRLALVVTGSGPEPLLTAELYPAGGSTVPLSGSVQFLDGDGPLGDPVALVAPDPDGASRVTLRPTLAEGRHGFAFVFLPDVSDFDLGYSNGVEYTVGTPPPAPTQGTEPVTVTATATGADGGPLVTGQPADVTVVVTPDAATATAAVTGSVTVTLGSSSFQVVEIGRQGSGPAGTTTVRVDPLDGTQLEARYAGDTVYAPGTASTTLTPGAGPVPAEVVRPVAMTASVLNPESSRIGDPVSVQVRVGPEGAVPPGSGPPTGEVLVSQVLPGDDGVVGDPRDSAKVVRARGRLTDGYVLLAVPTDELPVGALTLYVQFLGEAPWGGATATLTLTLDKASTYVTLVDSTPALGSTLVWGTPHTVRARVTSAVDGPRTLLVRQLVAGSLVTRRSVDVTLAGGTVTAPVDLTGALSPVAGADSEFVLEVAATDRAGAAATGDASGEQPLFPVRVLPAPLRLTVTSTPAVPRPGQSVTVDVRAVDATSGLPVAVSGRVVVARGTDGSGGAVDYPSSTPAGDGFTATFTAPAFLSGEGATADANTLLVSVTAGERPPGRLGEQVAHTAAAGSLLLVLTREAGPAPVVAWGTPRPAFAGGTEVPLTLTYPAPDGGAPVTGGVEVRTAGGVVVATTALVGGVGRTVVPVGAGDELVAAYLGDATYAPRTDLLPDPPGSLVFRPVAVLVASGSTTAVGSDPAGDVAAPTPATLTVADGEQVRFGGRVSGIPAGRVATLRVVGTGPAGAVDLGAASGDPVVLPPGTYLLRLVATFTPGDGATVDVAPVMSGPVTVVVSPPVAPLVTLTSLTAQPYAGAAARLRVRAQAPAGTRLSVSPGALARVYDVTGAGDPAQAGPPGRRVLLGTVPLTQSLVRPGEGTPYGYQGELETDALEGGARVLLAEVVYSDAALPATGQLDLLVDAPSLTLQASARPEQSGAARLEPGDRVVVDVAAFLGAPGGVRVRSSLQEVPASVELAGPAGRTLTLPVILTPSPLGGLRGQVGFLPGLPGQWRGTVRVTGDGSAFSSGLDTFGFEVFRHATAVTARLVSAGSSAAAPPEGAAPFAAGTSVTVEVAVRRSRVVVPGTPTPAAGTVTVRSGSSPGAPTCTATLGLDGTGRCALPEGALGAGRAVLFLDHAVSALDDASSSQLAVLGERRTTTTSSTLAPVSGADDPVLVGTTVRFSWTVRTAFLAAPGRVEVSDHRGQPLCDGVATVGGTGASTGSCTVTLPASALSGTARDVVRWTARFRPADAVSVASSTGGAEVHGRECVPLTGDALLTFTLLQGDACAVPAGSTAPSLGAHVDAGGVPVAVTRVLTGSRVRASATAPDRYVLRDWRVGDRPVDPTADDAEGTAATRTLGVTFTADGDDDVRFAQVYAPTCYTLTVPASLSSRGALSTNVRQFGTAYVGSYSNCERETDTRPEANGDQVRFAAGTAVTVVIDPDRERVTRAGVPVVGMELASVTGMTLNAPDALTAQSLDTGASSGGVRRLATVVMDADVTVGATFRVAGCLPLTLAAGTGGTLAVTSSSRPDSSAELSPYSGACTARGGTLKGYVPGTYVTVKATPDAAAKYSLHELVLGAASPAQLEAVPLGAPATTVVADTLATRVEPGTAVRARFSRVECVKVTVRLAVNLSTRPDVGVPMPRGERCESMPSIPSTSRTWDGDRYTISESSAWYLRKDGFSVTVDPTQRQTARYPFRLAEPYWTATPGGPQERSSGDSPYVRATAVPAGGSIVLDAVWRTPCRTLRVDVTQGVALLSVRGVETTEPDPDLGFLYCPPGQVADGQGFTLTAAGNPAVSGGPALFPYFSALSDDTSGTSPLRASSARVDKAFYRLLWCRTGGVSVQVRDGAGVLRNATLRELGQLQTDDSGCPNGSLEAGRTSTVRLNPLASELWSQEGPDLQVALDAAGRTAEGKTPKIVFAVRCHRITLGEDTEFVSTPNCPGDGGRFLRGGQVEVAAQVSGGNRLDGWVGIKVAFGEHALLVADQDRFVGADVHHTDWKERFVNGLSNFTQRLVGLGITIASGLLQAEMLLFTGAAALIRGVATGLAALGVDPAIVAGMNQAARYINVVGDTLGMMTDCIGTWSRGGPALTAVPVPEGTGEATDHAIGAATDRVEEATEKSLEAAAEAGSSSAKALGKGVVLIGVGRDVADALGSSVGSYSRPAAQGWSAFAGEVGSCLAAGIEDEVKGLVPMTDQEARDAAR